jgi:plastocyanin
LNTFLGENQKMASRTTYIVLAVVVIVIIVAGVLAYVFLGMGGGGGGGTLSGNNINIYASDSPYGFGASASNILSPGPTIVLTQGQTVTITVHNVGTIAHNFAIVTQKTDGNANLAFSNAQVGSTSSPIPAGGQMSATFTVGNAGSYYYICQVDSHVSLGMWGIVTVNP